MKNLIYGFFMAWGMFLAIPCPFPRWREEARVQMSACLPLIGGMLGGLWALLAWGLGIREGVDLGTRKTFADVAKTTMDALGVANALPGESFYGALNPED